MKQRRFALTESQNRYLFDHQGNINRHPSLTGRSPVTYFPKDQPEFYLKQFPEWPGYELASTLLMRLFGVQHLPYQDLIIIDSKYPVLLSQKVSGSPVLHVWDDPQAFHNLDPFHTGLLIISAMLINPEDGKEDNFILSEDGKYLIPIDSDHCFLPSFFQKEGSFWNAFTVNTALQTKTLLFCLDEMNKPIPLEVKQHILSINFDERLPEWMAELYKLENQFHNLIDQNQRNRFLEQGTVMRIPFYKQFIQNMHWKAHKIRDFIKTESQPTPFDLLKAVEPFAAKCYQDSFQKGPDLQTRFKAATDQLYTKTAIDGSRVSILNTRTMMEIINISKEELMKDAAFQRMGPVDAVELLNQLSQEHIEKTKIEQELLCELDARNQETIWIRLFGNPPIETALKAFLANPKEGLVLKGSKLITSSKLTELFAQTPDKGMRIRFLSLPDSPSMGDKEIRLLTKECPNLEYLDVSGCVKLKQIFIAEGEWPLLSRLEAKDCLNLERFVSESQMKILRIGTASSIEIIIKKSTLDIFTISNKTNELNLSVKIGEGFQLKLLNQTVSHENFVQSIFSPIEFEKNLKDMKIITRTFSISSANDLGVFVTVINLQNSKINFENIKRLSSLKLINLKKLLLDENVFVGTEILKYLVQADWPKLNHFSIGRIIGDGMQILAQGNWPLLEFLGIWSQKITEKEVEAITSLSKWPQLKHLTLSTWKDMTDEAVEILCQGNWVHLCTLSLSGKNLTDKQELNLILKANWLNLSKISLSSKVDNFSPKLLRQNWHLLKELDLSSRAITRNEIELIVNRSQWPKLKYLNLSSNYDFDDEGLGALSQGYWSSLQTLNLSRTKITAVGIKALVTQSKWPKLKHLDLSSNYDIDDEALETLAQGDWPSLETLNLKCTGVTKKGMLYLLLKANWPSLKEIICEDTFQQGLFKKKWPLLEGLDLSYSTITRNEIGLIVNKSQWSKLKYLNLSSNYDIDDEGLETLSQGDWPFLETLNLRDTKITTLGVEAIVTRAKWSKLKHLSLSSNHNICDESIETLSQGAWSFLETLSLSDTKITTLGIKTFVTLSQWSKLKHLNLSKNDKIKDEGLAILSQGNWPLLEKLNLRDTGITTMGVEAIVTQSKWPKLKHLKLSLNRGICDEGFKVLSQGDWPLLETLNLSHTKITAVGVEVLVTQSNWPKLKHLNLSDNDEIGDTGLEKLSRGNWHLLETLNLSRTKITAVGIQALVTQSKWTKLKYLDLSSNYDIDDEGLEALSQGDWLSLETLNLKWTGSTKKGLLNLSWKANWPNLKEIDLGSENTTFAESLQPKNWLLIEQLDLENGQITQKEIEKIVVKYSWSQLKHINLSSNPKMDDEGLAILSRGNWPHLETLNLKDTSLTNKGLLNLLLNANWPNFKEIMLSESCIDKNLAYSFIKKDLSQVQRLELRNSKIRLSEIEAILKRNRYKCPQLKHLDLSNNHIFAEGKISALTVTECPLLEELHLENTRIGPEEIKTIVNRSKWPLLKHLNISNNEIFDEGMSVLALAEWPLLKNLNLSKTKLSLKRTEMILNLPECLKCFDLSDNEIFDEGLLTLALKEWSFLEDLNLRNTKITPNGIETIVKRMKLPNLKKLNISENAIFDEGLKTLALGKWPLFKHLVYFDTKVTHEGNITLLESFKWPNLRHLEHSLSESFYNFNENFDEWTPSKIILAIVPISYGTQPLLVLILDMSWPNSKGIYLSIDYDGLKGKIMMLLPREKLKDFDTVHLSLEMSPTQPIVWPPNLKTLDLSGNSLTDETKLKSLLLKKCPPIESLCLLKDAKIGKKGIEVLARQSNWSNLKELHISDNQIENEELEMLTSGNWQFLENLTLRKAGITGRSIEILVNKSDWSNLRKLNISCNPIGDKGLETLTSGKWRLLKDLNLMETKITSKGLQILISKDDWSYLRRLNISLNSIGDKGLEVLISGKWQELEDLILIGTGITTQGLEILARESNWPCLKTLCIGNNKIPDEGLKMLSYGKWPLLEKLYLQNMLITKEGIEGLATTSDWPNLKILDISINKNVSDALALVSKKWPSLESLRVCYTKMTLGDVGNLVKEVSWPNLREIYLEEDRSGEYEFWAVQKLISENWPKIQVMMKNYNSLLVSELLESFDRNYHKFMNSKL